jgi:hypothetical protein
MERQRVLRAAVSEPQATISSISTRALLKIETGHCETVQAVVPVRLALPGDPWIDNGGNAALEGNSQSPRTRARTGVYTLSITSISLRISSIPRFT